MHANAILAGIINNNRKCSILILFLYPYLNIWISVQDVKSPGKINNWPKSAILAVEEIPGAPGATDPLTEIPQKTLYIMGSFGVSTPNQSPGTGELTTYPQVIHMVMHNLGSFGVLIYRSK